LTDGRIAAILKELHENSSGFAKSAKGATKKAAFAAA